MHRMTSRLLAYGVFYRVGFYGASLNRTRMSG
jgi:hypothetical protein